MDRIKHEICVETMKVGVQERLKWYRHVMRGGGICGCRSGNDGCAGEETETEICYERPGLRIAIRCHCASILAVHTGQTALAITPWFFVKKLILLIVRCSEHLMCASNTIIRNIYYMKGLA